MEPREVVFRRIVKRCRRIIAELEQVIRDKEWWNNNRLDASPFDIEIDRLALREARMELDCYEVRDMKQAAIHSRACLRFLTSRDV